MSNFIPTIGQYFYIEYKPQISEKRITTFLGNSKATGTITTSFREPANGIFLCVAIDDFLIVYTAAIVEDKYKDRKFTEVISSAIFHPVGPTVKQAFDLQEGLEENIIPVKLE